METNINKILLTDPVDSKLGAPLGAVDHFADRCKTDQLRCQRVYLVDGDYGPDGTYWGASKKAGHIYCAFNDGRDNDPHAPAMGVRLYCRAHTYEQAKQWFKTKYPAITFLRGGR